MRTKPYSVTAGLLCLTIFSGLILTSSSTSATDTNTSTDDVAITIPVACTLNASGNTSHNTTIVNGTYENEIGTTTLNVTCNDGQGFAIYAVGYTGNEIGATNSTKLVGTSVSSNATIDTGTATTAGNPDVSNWAMKLNTTTSPTPTYPVTIDNSFNAYHIVPASYTKVAHRDSGTDVGTNAVGSTLTTTYAAYISKTQAADTYSGQVKYTLVHPASEEPLQPQPATAGCINYFANGSNVVGEMGCQSATNNASVTLWAGNFKRDGYGFAGWNDKYDYTGDFYGPNQTITAPSDVETNGLSLYAVWVRSAGTIQNWNGCSSLTQDPNDGTAGLTSVTALTDERDNNTYAIAKLADGKCWTIENLRLADKDSNNNYINLSSSNTHNPSLPLTNIYSPSTTSNHLTASSSVAYDATTAPEGWCYLNAYYCFDQSRLRTDNTTLYINNTSSAQDGDIYSYGNYYNWYSATAGNGTYTTEINVTTAGDLCPAGWHLPPSREYRALNTAINNGATDSAASNKLRSYPSNFVYSGGVTEASINSRSLAGLYWSSFSGSSEYYVNGFVIRDNFVSPSVDGTSKCLGRTIHCIAGV